MITGGGIAGQLVKRGVGLATAGGAEAAFTGAMYGETPIERVGQAVLLGTAGATIGGAIACSRPLPLKLGLPLWMAVGQLQMILLMMIC